MVDSKENYKFDLTVKGLNSDGDDWSSLHSPPPLPPENDVIPRVLWPSSDDIAYVRSMGSCLRVAAPFFPRCYFASVSPFGGGGGGTATREL